jgi:hypothetical protein
MSNPRDTVLRAIGCIGSGPLADALLALAAGGAGGGGSGGGVFPNRFDLSVNSARIDDATAETPRMITGTAGNVAGGYNGGGTGNKGVLACKGHAGTLLSSITSIVWEWETLALGALRPVPYPYVNLVVDLGPPTGVRILVVDPAVAVMLNTGTLSSPTPSTTLFTHLPGPNFVQIVNVFGPVPAAISPVPLPIAAGAGPTWPGASFRYSDILAAYPAAVLVDAATGDGGLPLGATTPSVMLLLGGSTNTAFRTERILRLQINGANA